MEIFILVPIVLISTFLMGLLVKKLGLPPIIGQIIAGIILGAPILREIFFSTESSIVIIDFLAYLGIVFLLFLAGLQIDIKKIKETSHESMLISLSSALLPFLLGLIFIRTLFPDYGLLTAIVFGGALMVTSEATKVKVLMDLNSLNTHLGAVMMSAAMIDNIFVVIFLAILAVIGRGGGLLETAIVPVQLIIFIIVAFIIFKTTSRLFKYFEKNNGNKLELFSIVIIFIMVLTALSEGLGIGYLVGAIAGGFMLQVAMRGINPQHKKDVINVTELVALGFILPFFFANVGINFEVESLTNITLIIGTVLIAFAGKFLGTLMIKPISKLTLKQLYYVGWAMNSRGATELVIALAARQLGLIPLEVFSALVIMSLISTLLFAPILSRGINRNPKLMEFKDYKDEPQPKE